MVEQKCLSERRMASETKTLHLWLAVNSYSSCTLHEAYLQCVWRFKSLHELNCCLMPYTLPFDVVRWHVIAAPPVYEQQFIIIESNSRSYIKETSPWQWRVRGRTSLISRCQRLCLLFFKMKVFVCQKIQLSLQNDSAALSCRSLMNPLYAWPASLWVIVCHRHVKPITQHSLCKRTPKRSAPLCPYTITAMRVVYGEYIEDWFGNLSAVVFQRDDGCHLRSYETKWLLWSEQLHSNGHK